MAKRIILMLAVVCLLVMPMTGCKKAKATPTAVADLPTLQPTATDTPLPPTVTPVPPTETPTEAPTFTPVPQTIKEPEKTEPEAPELIEPEDEAAGSLFDLTWEWDGTLGDDETFVLWIWPDDDKIAPQIYGFYSQSPVRVTSANLAPGRYRWQVVVGKEKQGQAPDTLSPYSEVRVFIMQRPSLKANLSATPPATPTPTNSPTPTMTRTPWPTSRYTPAIPTATSTVMPPPPTSTPTGVYPGPTATLEGPTPTLTSVYPGITNTPSVPTATLTTEPYSPPQPTATVEPTDDPSAPTPEPTAEPTTYPF